MSTAAAGAKDHGGAGAFIRSRLGSALAIAPLGVWTIVHVWNNLAVFQDGPTWQAQVTGDRHPVSMVFTAVVVLLPLLIHTAWGLQRLRTSRPNNLRYGFFANLKYLLQRASAVGVLFFLGAHIWLAFLQPRLFQGGPEAFEDIAHEMRHHGPTLLVYVLGTLGVAYHLANGIYGFAMGWGLAATRASLRKFAILSWVVFLGLLAMSWAAIYGLWAAGA
jgi:succinate dehydrogenase / fumarate reductase cytochrome b subunit